uniref:P-loop-containing protein n=1 Tax=Pseudonocardia sp. CA-138482 TaxID=3240023 RepID=UPI003F4963E3
MTRRLIYLVGEPGVGKTTTMAALTSPLNRLGVLRQPTRTLYTDRLGLILAVELGRRRSNGYGGTDALSMSVMGMAERYLLSGQAATETNLLLAEGARLACTRFLSAAVAADWETHLVHLVGPALAAARRDERGSDQDPAWVRGAATRARRLFEEPPPGVATHRVIPAGTPQDVAEQVAAVTADPLTAGLLWPAAS